VNGLILPISLGVMLCAAHRRSIMGDYRHPVWMTIAGAAVVAVMAAMGAFTMFSELPKLFVS
jgi:Mn2+/Fe2+ NRAMP family transporter